MSEVKKYIQYLFSVSNLKINTKRENIFNAFMEEEENINAVTKIKELQKMITDKWQLKNRISDIIEYSLKIPNATVGKYYETHIDFIKLGWNDIVYSSFDNIEELGLTYNNESEIISGIPLKSGDFKISLKFRIDGEPENSEANLKQIPFIINADPKSLWKNLPSNSEDVYWKEDNVSEFKKLGDKHIVVASKRGRSHANVGSFRDDDYAFKHFESSGWSIIVVSDGAGSAKAARKGSELACKAVVDYFEKNLTANLLNEFDLYAETYYKNSINPPDEQNVELDKTESNSTKISKFIYNHLGGAANYAYKSLEDFSINNNLSIKDLHSTLIFTLVKKYSFGYVILSFGVGDCPIGLLNKGLTELKLMNWLDVGEFGGGTRFITMPEIFTSDKFSTRFGFKLIEDFSYLMLMTDGIYDPKFIVEANLEKLENWKTFLDDLKGENPDGIKVDFDVSNLEISNQLSNWMDFWSPGNHDDRTLAILF